MNREDRLRHTLAELRGKTVIVEGKKDVKALKSLEINNAIPINGKPLSTFAYTLYKNGAKDIVILTDYDNEGNRLYKKLKSLLERYKLFVDSRLRNKLKQYGKGRIEDFAYIEEDLKRKGDYHGKVVSNFDKIRDTRVYKGKGHSGKARRDRRSIRAD